MLKELTHMTTTVFYKQHQSDIEKQLIGGQM
jgi:hypothetical protein